MKRTKHKILSVFLSLCMIISCMVGMSVTASAVQTEEVLTVITPSKTYGDLTPQYSVADRAVLNFTGDIVNDGDAWGWYSDGGGSMTVTPAEGYTITRIVFTLDMPTGETCELTEAPFTLYLGYVPDEIANSRFQSLGTAYYTSSGPDYTGTDFGGHGPNSITVYGYTSSTPATTTGGFVKVTDASQITENNIGEGTEADAKAWIIANLDALKSEQGGEYDFFWKENGTLKLICLDYDELDEDNVNYADVLNPSIGNASRYFNNNENVYFWGGSSTPATSDTETLLTTITPTGQTTYSETTAGVVTVIFDPRTYYSEYGWCWRSTGSVTVAAKEGYTITRCVFRQNAKDPVEISAAPFEITFSERGHCVQNDNMDGVTSIEVYGYASTPSTPTVAITPEGAGTASVEEDPANSDNWLFTATPKEGYKFKWWALDHSNAPTGKYLKNTTSIVKTNFTESAGNNMITGITAVFEEDSTTSTVAVTGVTLNPSTATLTVGGDPVTLTATVAPADATDKKVKWSVGGENSGAVKLYSDANCTAGNEIGTDATETLTVYAKGISAGSATVTVTSNADSNKNASCAVTVNAETPVGFVALNENFDDGLGGWWVNTQSPAYHFEATDGYVYANPDNGDWGSSSTYCYSPMMDLSAAASATLVFKYKNPSKDRGNGEGSCDDFFVDYVVNNDSGTRVFEDTDFYSTAHNDWQTKTITLPEGALKANVQIRFSAINWKGLGAFFDDVAVYYTKSIDATSSNVEVPYDAQAHGITVNVTEPTSGYTVKYGTTEGTYNQTESPTITNVADSPLTVYYQVTADNYATKTGSATVTVTKADPETPTGLTATYGQTLANVTLPTGWAWADRTASVGNAGNNTFKANFTPTDTANYNTVQNVDVTVSVGKIDSTMTAPTAKTNLIYNGSEQALLNPGSAVGGKMVYSMDDVNYDDNVPKRAVPGTYTVYYKVIGDENHNDILPQSVTVKIGTPDGPIGPVNVTTSAAASSTTSTSSDVSGSKVSSSPKMWAEVTDDHNILVSWEKINGASKYILYRVENGKEVKIAETAKSKVLIKNTKNNVTFSYKLKYVMSGVTYDPSSSYNASAKVYYKPAVKAAYKNGKITLSWNKVPDAEKYKVYKYADGKLKAVTETTKNAVRISVSRTGTYRYAVKAYVDGKWTKVYTSDIVTVKAK